MSNVDLRESPDWPTLDAGTPREVSPNTNGYVIRVGGVDKGEIGVSSGNELTFHWYQTQSSWPADFDLVDTTSTLTIKQSDKFEHTTFNASSVSFDPSACQWQIEQDDKVIGYLHKQSNKLVWYATDLAPSNLYFAEGDLSFKSHSTTGTLSARDATDFSL